MIHFKLITIFFIFSIFTNQNSISVQNTILYLPQIEDYQAISLLNSNQEHSRFDSKLPHDHFIKLILSNQKQKKDQKLHFETEDIKHSSQVSQSAIEKDGVNSKLQVIEKIKFRLKTINFYESNILISSSTYPSENGQRLQKRLAAINKLNNNAHIYWKDFIISPLADQLLTFDKVQKITQTSLITQLPDAPKKTPINEQKIKNNQTRKEQKGDIIAIKRDITIFILFSLAIIIVYLKRKQSKKKRFWDRLQEKARSDFQEPQQEQISTEMNDYFEQARLNI